ncbi:hypothetical protein D1872_262870 [compost metagenome]
MLAANDFDFILRRAFGNKTIHTGLCRNGCRRQRVIPRAHNGFDAHLAQFIKTVLHPGFYRIFQIDQPVNPVIYSHRKRSSAFACNFVRALVQVARNLSALQLYPTFNGIHSPLANLPAVFQIQSAHPCFGPKLDKFSVHFPSGFIVVSEFLDQFNHGTPFRRLIL